MYHYTSFFLKFKSNLLVKRISLLKAAFTLAILELISPFASCVIRYHANQILEIFHVLRMFLIRHNLHCGSLL